MASAHYLFALLFVALALSDDTHATTRQLINGKGYPCDDLKITSEGYPLSVQRIPGRGAPVILQHGLFDTTATWVINEKETSLGFILSDAGYDVWMINTRGNKYSFALDMFISWNWSFEDEAHDIATAVEYVYKATNSTPVTVIAHSQGASMTLAALARIPSMAKNMRMFIALAPVTYLTHQKSPYFKALASVYADKVLGLSPNGPLAPTKVVLDRIFGRLCKLTPSICNFALEPLFGPDSNLNSTRMGVYTAHWPDITSIKNMIHWIQNARSGGFNDFIGVPYNLDNIKTPVFICSGTQDYLAGVEDVDTLKNKLGQALTASWTVEGFAHMDFVWSEKAAELVYSKILGILSIEMKKE